MAREALPKHLHVLLLLEPKQGGGHRRKVSNPLQVVSLWVTPGEWGEGQINFWQTWSATLACGHQCLPATVNQKTHKQMSRQERSQDYEQGCQQARMGTALTDGGRGCGGGAFLRASDMLEGRQRTLSRMEWVLSLPEVRLGSGDCAKVQQAASHALCSLHPEG